MIEFGDSTPQTLPMASFQKHPSGCRTQIYVKGIRESKVLGTKREAQRWAAARELEILATIEGRAGEIKTTHDAFSRYTEEISPTHKGVKWEVVRLEKMRREFPCVILSKLTATHIQEWRDRRLKEVKGASVLREMKLLNSVFEQCRKEWRWLSDNPAKDVRRPRGSPHRDRVITRWEIRRQLRSLEYPKLEKTRHAVAWAFLLALRTGMRQGELARIEWADVFESHIHLSKVKAIDHRTRDVPLSSKAKRLVEKLRGYNETSMLNLTAALIDVNFRSARAHAGLSGFTFHDSRHTAATWIAASGKWNVLELCKAFGWSDPKQAMVYFNPSAADLAAKLK